MRKILTLAAMTATLLAATAPAHALVSTNGGGTNGTHMNGVHMNGGGANGTHLNGGGSNGANPQGSATVDGGITVLSVDLPAQ